MKRWVCLAVFFGMLSFVGCGIPTDKETCSNSDIDALLLDTMNSKIAFIDEYGNQRLFKDYPIVSSPDEVIKDYGIAEKYTYVDMDNDGTQELIVYTPSDGGAYVVFHYDSDDQNIYGYTLIYRGFQDLRIDGRFSGSWGAASHNISTMSFNKTQLIQTVLAVNDKHPNSPDFQIAGQPVTEAEADAYFDEWKATERCTWYTDGIIAPER